MIQGRTRPLLVPGSLGPPLVPLGPHRWQMFLRVSGVPGVREGILLYLKVSSVAQQRAPPQDGSFGGLDLGRSFCRTGKVSHTRTGPSVTDPTPTSSPIKGPTVCRRLHPSESKGTLRKFPSLTVPRRVSTSDPQTLWYPLDPGRSTDRKDPWSHGRPPRRLFPSKEQNPYRPEGVKREDVYLLSFAVRPEGTEGRRSHWNLTSAPVTPGDGGEEGRVSDTGTTSPGSSLLSFSTYDSYTSSSLPWRCGRTPNTYSVGPHKSGCDPRATNVEARRKYECSRGLEPKRGSSQSLWWTSRRRSQRTLPDL